MSKSGNSLFSVTLEATTSDNVPVVIDPFQTLLGADTAALDHKGLTFKDTETGELAGRVKLNATVDVPDFVTPGVTIEIPAKGSEYPYTITHTFQSRDRPVKLGVDSFEEQIRRQITPGHPLEALLDQQAQEGAIPLEMQFQLATNQLSGFEIGHSYEIGLGTYMDAASWWSIGKISDVFGTRTQRNRRTDRPRLEMILQNIVVFEVAE